MLFKIEIFYTNFNSNLLTNEIMFIDNKVREFIIINFKQDFKSLKRIFLRLLAFYRYLKCYLVIFY